MARLGPSIRFLVALAVFLCLAADLCDAARRSSRYRSYRSSYSSSGGSGGGMVAGIVVGSILGIAGIVIAVILIKKYCANNSINCKLPRCKLPSCRKNTVSTTPRKTPAEQNTYNNYKTAFVENDPAYPPPPVYNNGTDPCKGTHSDGQAYNVPYSSETYGCYSPPPAYSSPGETPSYSANPAEGVDATHPSSPDA